MIPGPTHVPTRVLAAMATPMVNHRGQEFTALHGEVQAGLKRVFGTVGDLVIYPGSGTGGMEAALVNLFSPGDRILGVSIGAFGDRFVQIARRFGLQVDALEFDWGRAADPGAIAERLAADGEHQIKGILVTHNETSTGVVNPLEAIAKARGAHPALLVVDAVSSLGAVEVRADDWGLDAVVTGSQKALMIPPGLAILSLGPRAWAAAEKATSPRFYWDVLAYKKGFAKASTPYTPALSQWFALREALRMLEEEGLENAYRRHRLLGEMTRAGATALGLELLATEQWSPAVTALYSPVSPAALRKRMREDYGVVVAGGQGRVSESVFRIGHVGCVEPLDLLATLAALEMSLSQEGRQVHLGEGVAAAQRVWMKERSGEL